MTNAENVDQPKDSSMSLPEPYQRPQLRYRRFGGGYRREDVELALAELRLTLRQLDNDIETLRGRNRELDGELANARSQVEFYRAKEQELMQTMAAALRRATEIEDNAGGRAREIIAQAEEDAARIRADATRRIEETNSASTNCSG
jgi:cell division septum initiation protein DivIVA